jgi:hypothetical protein
MEHKKRFFIFFFLMITAYLKLYAQYGLQYDFMYKDVNFASGYTKTYQFTAPNKIEYAEYTSRQILQEPYGKSGTYTIDDRNGILYINIHWDKFNYPGLGSPAYERYLMLVNNDFIIFYKDDSYAEFFGKYYRGSFNDGAKLHNFWSYPYDVDASAYLVEGDIHYTPSKLVNWELNSAWAVKGGINESLLININKVYRDRYMYISIGYVAYSKPNLYRENARPKKIRIADYSNASNFRDIELADTPNHQEININGLGDSIQITILEIYPGTRYDDTCINNILLFSRQ